MKKKITDNKINDNNEQYVNVFDNNNEKIYSLPTSKIDFLMIFY